MRKKGFTLIELLAVIVILAIIALIATPLVLNIIDNTKKKTALQSAELYLSAVEQTIVSEMISGNKIENGSYEITDKGNICLEQNVDNTCKKELKISMKGKVANEGTIQIEDGKVTSATLKIDDKLIKKNGEKLEYADDSEEINTTPLYSGKMTYSEDDEIFILDSMVDFESLKQKTNYKLTLTNSNNEVTLIDNLVLYPLEGMGVLAKATEDSSPMLICNNEAGICFFQDYSLPAENEYQIKLETQNDKFIPYQLVLNRQNGSSSANMYFYTMDIEKGIFFDFSVKDGDNNVHFNETMFFKGATADLIGYFSYSGGKYNSLLNAMFDAIKSGEKMILTLSYYDIETEQLNGIIDEFELELSNSICTDTNSSNECIAYGWGNPNLFISN